MLAICGTFLLVTNHERQAAKRRSVNSRMLADTMR